jgi:hypothetical protein
VAGFDPAPLPTCEPDFRPDALIGEIHGWIASAPMRTLVGASGGELPELGTAELLGWLDEFSDEHWNFRKKSGNVERDKVASPQFAADESAVVVAAATALHLADAAEPPHPEYDHLLVLGGLGRACLQRTEYAARLIRSGAVSVGEVAALGSFRPLTDAEREMPGLAGGGYEADAMQVGVLAGFGFGADVPTTREESGGAVSNLSWAVRTYRAAGSPEVHVLAAPSSEPEARRANTPDTYEFWAQRVKLRSTDRILVVTSPIYVPFQHSDAIRMLGLTYRCGIDTIGFDPDKVGVPQPPEATGADRYLQEVRSGILSMRRLHDANA